PSPTAPYTLSLHDALPISPRRSREAGRRRTGTRRPWHLQGIVGIVGTPRSVCAVAEGRQRFTDSRQNSATSFDNTYPSAPEFWRSEEHTSELQSLRHLVCR